MSENMSKPATFRFSEEDIVKFKAFAKENNLNHQDAFTSLLNTFELDNAKRELGARAQSIEVFQNTVNKLVKFYINSLEENVTKEDRIREELSAEIKKKDDIVSNLYEQLQDMKIQNDEFKEHVKNIETKDAELEEQLKKANSEIEEKIKNLDIANRNNTNLQDQVEEYKQYKEQYKEIEKNLEKLKLEINQKDSNINDLNTKVKQLDDKVKNDSDMLAFYKNNIADLKDTIEGYKKDIKLLEDEYKQEVINIKAEQQNLLEKQIQGNTDMLNNLHLIELQKKDLEIQKLNNALEQLQNNSKKRTSKTEA